MQKDNKDPTKKEREAVLKEFMETCTEEQLYLQINGTGAFIWQMQHQINKGRIPEKDVAAVIKDVVQCSEAQKILVTGTKRFGVDFKMIETDGHLGKGKTPCEDYWKWYKHWDAWKNKMSDKEWEVVDAYSRKEERIPAELLPKKKWNEAG